MKKTAVLIPCYNEGRTIGKVIGDLRAALPDADIYVYDNNSTDDTARIARDCGAVVRAERRQGKGNVIRTMFREIDADCYLMIDGDDTYPAESAKALTDGVLLYGADMVVGDRLSSTYFRENKRRFHNGGNRLVRGLINRLFDSHIQDIMTGYRAFSPLFVKSFPVLSKGFEIETEMTIHSLDKNFNIMEIPVNYRDRPEGSESKLNTVRDGVKVIGTIFCLFRDYRPFLCFSLLSALCWLFAAVFGIPVVAEYFRTGLVPRFPTLIVSCAFSLFGLMTWVCGVILTVMNQKHRHLFELYLIMLQMRLDEKAD